MREFFVAWLALVGVVGFLNASYADELSIEKYVATVLRNTSSIRLELVDRVDNGCWSTSSETRLKIERELGNAGLKVRDDGELILLIYGEGRSLIYNDVRLGCIIYVSLTARHFGRGDAPNGKTLETVNIISFERSNVLADIDTSLPAQNELLSMADDFLEIWLNEQVL